VPAETAAAVDEKEHTEDGRGPTLEDGDEAASLPLARDSSGDVVVPQEEDAA
jgi:hypothetical protein